MSRVTVTNPYDLLDDENEDRTTVVPKKEQKPAAPAAKPAAKVAAKPAAVAKTAAKPAAAPKADAKAKPADKAVANKNSASQAVRPAPQRDSNQSLQERDKESRAPREKRDYRAPNPNGEKKGRTFDRKSGSGRPANENKKGGQGKGNWGGVEAKEGAEALKDKEEKVEEKEETETTGEKPAVEGEEKKEEKVEEVKEELTLDEYLAKKKIVKPVVAAFQPRTVNAEEFGAAGLVPLERGEQAIAPLNPKKKADKAKEPKTEKPAEKAQDTTDLAAKLLHFSSHQDDKRREFRGNREFRQDRPQQQQQQGGDRRPPRNNNNNNSRPPRNDAKGPAASQAPTIGDFPSLGVNA